MIMRVNQAELDLLGYGHPGGREEYVGRHIAEFHVDQPVIEEMLVRLFRGETLRDCPARLRCKDGSIRDVLINSSALFENGRFIHTRCFTHDITERKAAEEAIARLAAIVASSDDAIISNDLEGVITTWNRGAEHLFGYTAEEAIGQSVKMLMPDGRLEEMQEIIARIKRGKLVHHYETVRRRKDGVLLNISLTVSPLRDSSGRIVGASKIGRDITERTRMEQKTRDQTAELADLHRRKDEFLAMLGHELRNPLAPITNALHLLRLQKGEDQVQQQARTIIERQVRQLSRLVDDLLEISRISTGRIHLHQERVALNGIVENAIETVGPLIGQHRHSLEASLSSEPIWLNADASRLEQVVVNLLTNAAKYTPDGGQILLSVRQEGDEGVLRVKDSGVGIAPELLPHIFDLFTQAERSLDRAQGGLGIGLSLVQRLVELHQGRVEAHSKMGEGSEFVVYLPVLQAPALPPAPVAAPATKSNGPSRRVLVVDDNIDAAQTLGMLLKVSGNEVRTVYNGLAALEAAAAFLPDVVLLDIGLPGLDGYEVAKRLREQPASQQAVLIAMTGYGQEAYLQRSLAAGFNHHLVKPVRFEKVQEILAGVLPKPA